MSVNIAIRPHNVLGNGNWDDPQSCTFGDLIINDTNSSNPDNPSEGGSSGGSGGSGSSGSTWWRNWYWK